MTRIEQPLRALQQLLLELFDEASSLVGFLKRYYSRDLLSRLPGKDTPLAHYALETVDALERDGLVDDRLFQALADTFPDYIDTISRIALELEQNPPETPKPSTHPNTASAFVALGMNISESVLSGSGRGVSRTRQPPPRDVAWVRDFLVSGRLPQPRASNPATLLNARYSVVPFHEWLRAAEIQRLSAWCEDKAPVAILTLAGPGGVGKTRLALKLVDWAQECGFAAGFAPHHASHSDLQDVLEVRDRVLVIVDYAETRSGLHTWLEHVASLPQDASRHLRIVLIVRDLGDWWDSIQDRSSSELRALLTSDEPLKLRPGELASDERSRVFAEASEHFAHLHGINLTTTALPDLTAPHFGKILYLHMAALARVEGRPTEFTALLEETRRRERQFWWRDLLDSGNGDAEIRRELHALDLAVAALTLAGGAHDEAFAQNLLDRAGVSSTLRQRLLLRLGDLYPGTGYPHARDRFLAPLEPDLLGEAHTLAVLLDRSVPPDWLAKLFRDASPEDVRPALVLLGRLCHTDPAESTDVPSERANATLRAVISALLDENFEERAPVALDVASTLAERSLRSPLAEVLESTLRSKGTPELATTLLRQSSSRAIALHPIEQWIGESVASAGSITPRLRFAAFIRLSVVEMSREHAHDARRYLEEAVTASIAWKEQDDSASWSHALGLGLLGVAEGEVGELEQSLATARVSMKLCEDLEQRSPAEDKFVILTLRELFAIALLRGGAREEAIALLVSLVPQFEQLVIEREDLAFSQALCDYYLGVAYLEINRHGDAAISLRRAVERQRAVVREHRGSELANLARSLTLLGDTERCMGNPVLGRELALEAIMYWGELDQVNQDGARSGLALSLCALSQAEHALNEGAKAKVAATRAVAIWRELVDTHSGAFRPNLVLGLLALGSVLDSPADRSTALVAFQEAIERVRPFAEKSPATFQPLLARSHLRHALCTAAGGDTERAVAEIGTCLQIYAEMPESEVVHCATERALAHLMRALFQIDDTPSARDTSAITEALAHFEVIADSPSSGFVQGFLLFVRGMAREEPDDDARQDLADSVEALRKTHQGFPGGSRFFAQALGLLADLLDYLGEPSTADSRREEAIYVLRALGPSDPVVARDLAEALNAHALKAHTRGEDEQAYGLFRETEGLMRSLPEGERDTLRDEFLDCLAALGELEPEPERRLHYLREAVALSGTLPDGGAEDRAMHLERLIGIAEELASLECFGEAIAATLSVVSLASDEERTIEISIVLADAHESLAEIYESSGAAAEPCVDSMRSAVDVWRHLYTLDPGTFRGNLVEAQERLCNHLLAAGLEEEAARVSAEMQNS